MIEPIGAATRGRSYGGAVEVFAQVRFRDADADLKGGWLEFGDESLEHPRRLALTAVAFGQAEGRFDFRLLVRPGVGSVWLRLVDSQGEESEKVSVPITGSVATWQGTLSAVGIYDDFDGHGPVGPPGDRPLAVAGSLSYDLWGASANDRRDLQVVDGSQLDPASPGHGDVLRMLHAARWREGIRSYLVSPPFAAQYLGIPPGSPRIAFDTFGSVAADVLVSSESDSASFVAGIELSAGLGYTVDYSPKHRSWRVGLRRDPGDGRLHFAVEYRCFTFPDESSRRLLGEAQLDRWYNVRFESERSGEGEIRFRFLVDGQLMETWVPQEHGRAIDDPGLTNIFGPARALVVFKEAPDGDAIAYFDNVVAVHEEEVP